MSRTSNNGKVEELDLILDRGVDVEARRIYLFQGIDSDAVHLTIPTLTYLNRKSNKPIEIWIESDGGEVESLLAIYDAIKLSKAPIHTIGTGQIASAAFVLACCGNKRLATKECVAMHHAPTSISIGDSRDLQAGTKAYNLITDKMYRILEEHSGKDAKWWKKEANNKGELWMDTQAMLELEVIDEII